MWRSVFVVAVFVLSDGASAKSISADLAHRPQHGPENQIIGFCSDATSFTSCIKLRSLVLLNSLTVNKSPIHLFGDSLTLVNSVEGRKDLGAFPTSVNELESTLPKDDRSKDVVLDELVSSSLSRFINSRSLQIRLPDLAFWNWTIPDEGRKRKGGAGLGPAFLSMGGMMGAMWLGAIALMAGKALTVSMMALMLAILASLKKGGGGGDHSTTYEVISVPTGHGHSHHGRSLSEGVQIAYRSHNNSGDHRKPSI